jgi:hypothetical protein
LKSKSITYLVVEPLVVSQVGRNKKEIPALQGRYLVMHKPLEKVSLKDPRSGGLI